MKTVLPNLSTLQALFATREFNMALLYQFNLVNGATLYYTSADVNIVTGGNTYSGANAPYFETKDNRSTLHWKVGTDVDQFIFDVIPGASTVEGIPFLAAVQEGFFDGAELVHGRAYWPIQAWAASIVPTAVIPYCFVGRVGEVDGGRTKSTFTINSHMELFNQMIPRNLFQSGCVNSLYDASCTLIQASFGVSGTTSSGSTASSINATLSQATGYFNMGTVTYTSGVNNGLSATIKIYTHGSPSNFTLIAPLPNTPSSGDTFTVYPGCDKLQATCQNKFSNITNFRGQPYIPTVETAV